MSVGVLYARPRLFVNRALTAPLSALPSALDAPETAGLFVGSRFNLGKALKIDGLDGGFSLYLPPHLFRWSIRPDDDLQWALLTDRTQVLSAEIGLAYRPVDWLSLGVGVRILFDVQTLTRGDVTSVGLERDPLTGKTIVRTHTQLGVDAQVFGRATPIFGALLSPTKNMRFGIVYRHQSFVDDWGNTRIDGVPSLGTIGYTHHFAHYFEPSQFTLAAGVDLGKYFDCSADFTYALWSEAQTTNRNSFTASGFTAPLWGNTLTPAFGARLKPFSWFSILAGYRYQRSPLDNASGPTNLLDNDKHTISSGMEIGPPVLRLSVGMGFTILDPRMETKDFRRFPSHEAFVQNPGYPFYSYGGHILSLAASVEGKF